MFEGQKDCTFYTKDEMIDFFWSRYERMLQSMDNALAVMDTSLSDAGFSWKKNDVLKGLYRIVVFAGAAQDAELDKRWDEVYA